MALTIREVIIELLKNKDLDEPLETHCGHERSDGLLRGIGAVEIQTPETYAALIFSEKDKK